MAALGSSTAPIEPSRDPNDVEIVPDEAPYASDDPAFLTETDAASSTQSLSSSVLSYQYENGRRYHGFREGEYNVPNDDREQDRMDLHHHIYQIAVGGDLFRAPVDLSKARVLDIGTGTGIWALDVADEYPGATVIGTDLSPIQPGWVPPNCHFEVDDFESDWGFSRPFKFIHGRTLAGSVRDVPRLCQQAYSHLEPGGWLEFADFVGDEFYSDDDTLQNAPTLVKWASLNAEAFHKFGKEISIAKDYKKHMIDAGFKNVREEIYKIPLNPWPKDRTMKDLGRYHQINMIEGMEAYSLAIFTRVLGWSLAEIHAFFAEVRRELQDRSLHVYARHYFVYGQKEE